MAAQEANVTAFFDQIAASYGSKYKADQPFHYYFFTERLAQTLQAVSVRGKRVLDIGAGTGAVYDALQAGAFGADYYATDVSSGMLSNSNIPAERRFVGACYDAPFADQKFDVLLMLGVTTYLDETECNRVLKFMADQMAEGGEVALTFTHRKSLDYQMRLLLRGLVRVLGFKKQVLGQGFALHAYSYSEAQQLMDKYFQVKAVHCLNHTVFPWGVLLPGLSVWLARQLHGGGRNSGWRRWLSSDLLFVGTRKK